jgi:hypothetical protein
VEYYLKLYRRLPSQDVCSWDINFTLHSSHTSLSRYILPLLLHTMVLLRAFTSLLSLLACSEFSSFVSAAPAATALSPTAQALINSVVAWQKGTGHQWDLLAAEALVTLVGSVVSGTIPSHGCTLDNISVRREW